MAVALTVCVCVRALEITREKYGPRHFHTNNMLVRMGMLHIANKDSFTGKTL